EDGALFLIEREEKLAALACAAVLVDSRRTRCRRSLRWDVLPVRLPTGAAQHAKITLLVWERRVRAVVASANLTEAGYLRQQEVFGVLDCPIGGDGPSAVLRDVVEFLDELVGLTAAPATAHPLLAPTSRPAAPCRSEAEAWLSCASARGTSVAT